MTTTPASTTPRVSSTIGVRIRSLAGWADQIDTAQLLHVTAVTVAAAVAVLAMLDAAISLCEEILEEPAQQRRVVASALRSLAGLKAMEDSFDDARLLISACRTIRRRRRCSSL